MRRVFTNADFQAELANSHRCLGELLQDYHELGEAENHYREAFRLWTELCNKRPSNLFYRSNLARSHSNLADLLEDTGPMQQVEFHRRQAWSICERLSQDFPRYYYQNGNALPNSAFDLGHVLVQTGRSKEAKEICRKALELARDDPETNSVLAWQLSTWADPELRDPARAVKLAKKAIDARPKNADFWSNLGLAQYQAGNSRAALYALEESMRLTKGGTCQEWFFAAMAHWKLDEKEQARKFYHRGDQGMRKGPPDIYDKALLRFRAEAAKLLEIEEPPAKEKEASSKKN
jgi:tetratricopeptide (TPR) repeat protein